jgi:hypothetical protein
MALSKDYISYIKASWLAGNRREDVAAEIIRFEVSLFGICRENDVYQAIDTVYFILNNAFFAAMANPIFKGNRNA